MPRALEVRIGPDRARLALVGRDAVGRVGDVDEAAAWRELEAAIGEALWRYAEAVTGVRRDSSGEVPGGRLTAGRTYLARLSAARRARQVRRAAEDAAAAAAIEHDATPPDDASSDSARSTYRHRTLPNNPGTARQGELATVK